MENEITYNDNFIVTLTIENTQYKEVLVEVTDPKKTIREQIKRIIEVFRLPKMDNGGSPVTYLLGRAEEEDSPTILEFEDADGREQTLMDYNVQPGDHLLLISGPGGGDVVIFSKIAISNKSLYINDILDDEMKRYGYKCTNKRGSRGRVYEKSKLIKAPKREKRQEEGYYNLEDRTDYIERLYEKRFLETINRRESFMSSLYEKYYYDQKRERYYCGRRILLSKLPPELLYDGLGGFQDDSMFLDQWHGKKIHRLCDYETEEESDIITDYYIYTSYPHPKWDDMSFLRRIGHFILNAIRR